ncbi:hypothetical protein H5410_020821, partial [Solanum commersonii]
MAELYIKQTLMYSKVRPSYPEELFNFITPKTPCHDLVWDVGTGSGQAAKSLEFAAKVPNVRYMHTSAKMSMSEIETKIGAESSVDLVTSAQAMHWFDLPTFYPQVKWLLKKPNGVTVSWCYTMPQVNNSVDTIFEKFDIVVDGCDHNGPFEFKIEKVMDLDSFFIYLKSWSAYQTAKEKGVELLSEDFVDKFTSAWNEDGKCEKK